MTFHLTKKERPLNYCPLPPRQICICPDALSDWDMLENNLDNNRVLRITLSSPRQWNLIWLFSEASHNTSYFRQLSYNWNQVSMRMWSMFDLSTLIIPKILKLFFRNFPFDKSSSSSAEEVRRYFGSYPCDEKGQIKQTAAILPIWPGTDIYH